MSITSAGCSAAPAASPASHRCKCRAAEAVTGYARVPAAEIVGVALDDFTALYHLASGITHLVTSPVPELLDVLGEAPLGLVEIAARLAAVFGVEDEEAVAGRIAALNEAGSNGKGGG